MKITTLDIEIAMIAKLDTGYATEIEIKISKADIKKDKEKRRLLD